MDFKNCILSIFISLFSYCISAQKSEIRVDPFGHVNAILSSDVSKNNKWFLTGGANGRIVLWDLETQRIIRAIQSDFDAPVSKVFFSDDNAYAISLQGRQIPLPGQEGNVLDEYFRFSYWDLSTGNLINAGQFVPAGNSDINLYRNPNMDFDGTDRIILFDDHSVYFSAIPKPGLNLVFEKLSVRGNIVTAYFQDLGIDNSVHIVLENRGILNDAIYDFNGSRLVDVRILEKNQYGDVIYCFDQTIVSDIKDYLVFRDLKRGFIDSLNKNMFNSFSKEARLIRNPFLDGDASFNSDGSKLAIAINRGRPFARTPNTAAKYRLLIKDTKAENNLYMLPDTLIPIIRPVNDISWTTDKTQLLTVSMNLQLSFLDLNSDQNSWLISDISGLIYFDIPKEQPEGIIFSKIGESIGYWDWTIQGDLQEFQDSTIFHIVSTGSGFNMFTAAETTQDSFLQRWVNGKRIVCNSPVELSMKEYRIMDIIPSNSGENVYLSSYTPTREQDAILVEYNLKNGATSNGFELDNTIMKEISVSDGEKFIASKHTEMDNAGLPYNYRIWELESGKEYTDIYFRGDKLTHHHFGVSDSMAITVTDYNNYVIWNTFTGAVIQRGRAPGQISDVAIVGPKSQALIMLKDGAMFTYNYMTEVSDFIWIDSSEIPRQYTDPVVSSNGKYVYMGDEGNGNFMIFDLDQSKVIVDTTIRQRRGFLASIAQQSCYFLEGGFVLTGDIYGQFQLWDLEKEGTLAAHLRILPNKSWGVYTNEGTFDGNKDGRDQMYYVVGQEIIEFDQLKDRYWVPGLLQKILNRTYYADQYTSLTEVPLYPEIKLSVANDVLSIHLTEKSGGIGPVSLFINGVERMTNIKGNPNTLINISLDSICSYMEGIDTNIIAAQAYEASGRIHSRKEEIIYGHSGQNRCSIDQGGSKGGEDYSAKGSASSDTLVHVSNVPSLYALLIGTSEYDEGQNSLNFPDKDARVFEDAISKVGFGIFENRVHTFRLTTDAKSPDSIANKTNIIKAFRRIQDEAKAYDVVILFFSGHGETIDDDFYYLTKDVGKRDTKDTLVRQSFLISSSEIKEWIRGIKAYKQVLILDACYSGQAAQLFSSSKSTGTTQEKALEMLEGKMGVYLLASSTGSEVSWESHKLNQGILTYGLLMGLSGGAITDSIIQIGDLLNYASQRSESLCDELLGFTQTPVVTNREGASSWPIGTIHESVNFTLPKNVKRFGAPRIAVEPDRTDPEKLEFGLQTYLKDNGTFGSDMEYIYWDNEFDKDVYLITGNYTVSDEDIVVTWYLVNNETRVKGEFTTTKGPEQTKEEMFESMVNQAISELTTPNSSQ